MLALLFPGQGSHGPSMFDGLRTSHTFSERHDIVCEFAGCNVVREIQQGNTSILDQNVTGSLATLLASSLSFDAFLEQGGEIPAFMAGYSIGQWAALYAGGAVDFEQLCRIVSVRGMYMNECLVGLDTGMAAVIGLDRATLEQVISTLQKEGHPIHISNYNCRGQHSIAGTVEALRQAEEKIKPLQPRKFMRLPVSGAWHCPLLTHAAEQFYDFLSDIILKQPSMNIVDNVTGQMLPVAPYAFRSALSRHIDHPVKWQDGIETLINQGCTRFIEIGFNNMLEKFMFFINRNVETTTFYR